MLVSFEGTKKLVTPAIASIVVRELNPAYEKFIDDVANPKLV